MWGRVLISVNIPGFRGSHTLRIGSEPPAAIRAEPSPPTCKQWRAFPQNCKSRTSNQLNFNISH
jgi:hypothetical protein